MSRLIIVIGMPGSGKTTYLQKLAQTGEADVIIDDYQKDPLNDDYLDPTKSQNYKLLIESLRAGKHVALADRRYCLQDELDKLASMVKDAVVEVDIQLCYFENNQTACKHNVKQRNRPGYVDSELEFLRQYSPIYNPPEAKTLRIVGSSRNND